jgi:L-amino acid N-acyltransferase YncA
MRDLEPSDAEAVAGIFNSAIAQRLATFDDEPTRVSEIEADLRSGLPGYPGIAVTLDSAIVAYALSSAHSTYEPRPVRVAWIP